MKRILLLVSCCVLLTCGNAFASTAGSGGKKNEKTTQSIVDSAAGQAPAHSAAATELLEIHVRASAAKASQQVGTYDAVNKFLAPLVNNDNYPLSHITDAEKKLGHKISMILSRDSNSARLIPSFLLTPIQLAITQGYPILGTAYSIIVPTPLGYTKRLCVLGNDHVHFDKIETAGSATANP